MRILRALARSLAVPVVLLVVAGTAGADHTKPKRGRPHQAPPTGAEDAPGVTPDAAAEAELDAMTSRSSVGLVVTARPDGTQMVDLEGRFMSVAVAGPSGPSCHTGSDVKKARKVKARKAKVRKAPAAPIKRINGLEVM